MKNFFNFLASLFDSSLPTSASRFLAFMAMVVLCGGVIYFFIWCKVPADHISVFNSLMIFISVLVGLVKVSDVIALRTGVRVSQSEEKTPTGSKSVVEKTVTEVQQQKE